MMIGLDTYRGKSKVLLGFLLLVSCVPLVKTIEYSSFDAITLSNECSGVDTSGTHYPSSKYAFPIDPAVIWMANRITPLSSAVALLFHPNGTLQLSGSDQNQDNPRDICYNMDFASVKLQNSGKPVLKNINRTEVWKGLDFSPPTSATWPVLPGPSMHLNQSHSLISWQKKTQKIGNSEIENDTYSFGWYAKQVLPLSWTSPKDFLNWKGRPYIGNKSPSAILSGHLGPVLSNVTTMKRIWMSQDRRLRILQYMTNQTVTLNRSWEAVVNLSVSDRQRYLFDNSNALYGFDRVFDPQTLAVEKLPEPPATKKDNKWVKILASTVGILGVLLIIVVAIFCLWRYKKIWQWLRACGCCGLCCRRPKPRYEYKFPGDTPVRTEPEDGGVELEVKERGPRCHCAVSCVLSFNHSGSPEF